MRPSFHAFADEMLKIAEEEKKKSPAFSIAKAIGSGLIGFGAGTAAGLGTGYLADYISQKTTGKKIPKSTIVIAAPLLGTASGIAYSIYKAREQEAIRRALEDSADNRGWSVSGK